MGSNFSKMRGNAKPVIKGHNGQLIYRNTSHNFKEALGNIAEDYYSKNA